MNENKQMEELKTLLDKGVSFEDEFIETYMKVIRDEGFLQNFGEHQEEAKKILDVLIKESDEHKKLLLNIMNNLKTLWF